MFDLGFCGSLVDNKPLHVTMLIPKEGQVSADQFIDWFFLAENGSEADKVLWHAFRKQIKRAFIKHMGAEVIDAERLR